MKIDVMKIVLSIPDVKLSCEEITKDIEGLESG
jgi:hypothetical protein